MQISDLKLNSARRKRKTVGRGGKKGTYSGRGCKGQKARSGASIDPLFEGGRSTLIDHMKKKRGFTSKKVKPVAIKFADIERKFSAKGENGSMVSMEALIENNLIKKTEAKRGVKIIGPKTGKKEYAFEKGIVLSKNIK